MGALPTSPNLSAAIRSWIDCVWAGSVAIVSAFDKKLDSD